MRTLTLKQLTYAGACEGQVELFRERFGESVKVTEELCRSVAGEFDWGWAARCLLSRAAQDTYDAAEATAWDAYYAARAATWAAYRAAAATAFARAYIEDEGVRPS